MEGAKLKWLYRTLVGTVGLTAVTAVLLFVPLPLPCRAVATAALLGWLSLRLGRFLVGNREGRMTRFVFGLTVVLSWLAVSQSVVYYLDRISKMSLLLCLIPPAFFAVSRLAPVVGTVNGAAVRLRSSVWSRWLSAGVLIGDAALFVSYLFARTDEALRSPWEVIPWPVLLMFLSVTWLLLLLCREPDAPFRRALTALHLFVAYCLSETVMSLGFGYDPFIHRTAEAHIAEFGSLLPKSPYYVGHYVLVVVLHWLSGLSVDAIDRWMVPLLGPLTFPWVASFGLRKVWGMKGNVEFWTPLLLLLPMLPLTFTVPHALTVILLLWLVFLAPSVIRSGPLRPLVIGLSVAAMFIHPLLGAVAVGLLAALFLCRHVRSWLGGLLSVVVNAAMLPTMFLVYNRLKEDPPFSLADLLPGWVRFAAFFRNPFLHVPETPFSFLDLLYAYRTAMPLVFAVVTAVGAIVLTRQKLVSSAVRSYILTVVGLLVAIFVLSASVTLSGIAPGEQLEFSLRLKQSLGVLLLPPFLFGLKSLLGRRIGGTLTVAAAGLLLAAAVMSTVGWYLTYPQANRLANRSGWCLGRADVEAIGIVAQADDGRPYLALSNQMLSVAALRANGFDRFSYALPVTGRAYEYFLAVSHSRRNRGVFEEAFAEFGVERVFYVVHDYEPQFQSVVSELGPFADREWTVDSGRIAIFLFEHFDYN